jgi:hypothetical protein
LTIVLAVVSGAAAALVVGKINATRAAPASVEAHRPEAGGGRPPPGWNPLLMARLSAVEARLGQLEQAALPAPAQAGDDAQPASPLAEAMRAREEERKQLYDRELDALAQAVSDHQAEPVDAPWADGEKAELTAAFGALKIPNHPFQVKDVSCRSKTCFVTATFDSASDALAANDEISGVSVPGCRGRITTLEPPTHAGAYDVRVLYNNCR